MTDTEDAARRIRDLAGGALPRCAVLLGSGWGPMRRRLIDPKRIDYAELPGFPRTGVAGHAGELWLGRIGRLPVALLGGRRHAYEGGEVDGMKLPLRALRALGCTALVQTCAAGSLRDEMPPGSLMLVTDHLNLPQRSPLVGEAGPARFVDLRDAYDPALRELALRVAAARGSRLHEGVYAWCLGPQFETPAEIRMCRLLGAAAVGMSTVPETIVARHAGLRVLAIALLTNMAAGLSDEPLGHAHTLARAEAASDAACALLHDIVAAMAP